MFGSWIRRTGFWILDALKGGTIRNHYKDIVNKMSDNYNDRGKQQLEALLEYAKSTTPFYRRLNSQKLLNSIEDFPIVTKMDYKEQFDAFQSEVYLDKPKHQMSTSGSTGTPFTVNQDMNKRKRVLAEIIYFNEICGQKLGDKYIYFRVWTDKNRKSRLERFMQNLVPVDILHLDDANLEKIRCLLKRDKSIKSALAYASTYEHLVNYLTTCGDNPGMFNINLFVTSSEVLDMQYKKRIKETIGCDIIDRYSNQENGIIAQTPDMSDEFIVSTASYYVELLKLDSDEDAADGELGRIIVTDLYNFAMPMIRYDTGDLAIKCEASYGGIKKFKAVQGRRVDTIYDTKGNRLTPISICNYMWGYTKLKQYQFIQEDAKKYTLKVNGAEGIYAKDEFERTLKGILGSDAEIDIQFVDTIPVLASGKFKKTICNYMPEK